MLIRFSVFIVSFAERDCISLSLKITLSNSCKMLTVLLSSYPINLAAFTDLESNFFKLTFLFITYAVQPMVVASCFSGEGFKGVLPLAAAGCHGEISIVGCSRLRSYPVMLWELCLD